MTYSPGNPGYPPAQAAGSYPGATPSFAKEPGESKLPFFLIIATVILGLLVYLANFGPGLTAKTDVPGLSIAVPSLNPFVAVVAAVLASLLGAASLLSKAKGNVEVVAAVAVLGLLVLIQGLIGLPDGISVGWGLWLILLCSVFQAFAAVAAALLEAGVITAPEPRPKYDAYAQYGQYGQQHYGQYGQQPYYGPRPGQHQPSHQQPAQQSPQYGSQYGGYGSSHAPTQSTIPTTGGFAAQTPQTGHQTGPQPAAQAGPEQDGSSTPPTGFPSFSPPPPAEGEHSAGQEQQSPSSGTGPAPE